MTYMVRGRQPGQISYEHASESGWAMCGFWKSNFELLLYPVVASNPYVLVEAIARIYFVNKNTQEYADAACHA